jgi:hypothetical protein
MTLYSMYTHSVSMTKMRIDPDAHAMLLHIKTEMKSRGINSATFSDAIRYVCASRQELLQKSHLVG